MDRSRQPVGGLGLRGLAASARLLPFVALVCSDCTTETVVIVGDHLTYAHSPSLEPCGGTPGYMDRFIPFLTEELGLGEIDELEFRWLDRESYARELPGSRSVGTAIGSVSWSRDAVLTHELVHNALWTQGYLTIVPFLDEGIAQLYEPIGNGGSGGRLLAGGVLPTLELELSDSLTVPKARLDYNIAGGFTAFLLYRYGHPRFLRLLRRLRLGPHRGLVELAFLDVYGTALEDEFEAYKTTSAEDLCASPGHPIGLYECHQPGLGIVGAEAWTMSWSATCGDPKTFGGLGEPNSPPIFGVETFELDEARRLAVEFHAPEGVEVSLGTCDPCPFNWTETLFNHEVSTGTLDLGPGRYYLRFSAQDEHSESAEVYFSEDRTGEDLLYYTYTCGNDGVLLGTKRECGAGAAGSTEPVLWQGHRPSCVPARDLADAKQLCATLCRDDLRSLYREVDGEDGVCVDFEFTDCEAWIEENPPKELQSAAGCAVTEIPWDLCAPGAAAADTEVCECADSMCHLSCGDCPEGGTSSCHSLCP